MRCSVDKSASALVDRACKVVDRDHHRSEQRTDAEAEEHDHERLDEADERVDRIGDFATIELAERIQDIAELACFFSHADHGYHDARNLRVLAERV